MSSAEQVPGGEICPSCAHRNEPGARFCSRCATALHGHAVSHLDTEQVPDLVPTVLGRPVLVVEDGHRRGATYPVEGELVRVGRHPDAEIFLDDVTVSRRHVELRPVDGTWELRDLGSLNGTYVNRERADVAVLRSGDEVQIGKFKLVFLLPEDPA